MTALNQITNFLDKYLAINQTKDASFNGLQFEGKQEVNKILFTTDSGIETFQKAKEINADLIIVHHGLFWQGKNPNITGIEKQRLQILFENQISLYTAHLPLDNHKEVGNNAQLIKILGADIKEPFLFVEDKNIGWIGEFGIEKSLTEIESILNKQLNTTCKTLNFGNQKIKTIAVCSGGVSGSDITEAIQKQVDLILIGEPKECYHTIKDAKTNIIFAGHHATETVGVKALSEIVKKRFNINCEFVDIPTGL